MNDSIFLNLSLATAAFIAKIATMFFSHAPKTRGKKTGVLIILRMS